MKICTLAAVLIYLECFIATFIVAKSGLSEWEQPSVAARSSWRQADRSGLFLPCHLRESASPAEVPLVRANLACVLPTSDRESRSAIRLIRLMKNSLNLRADLCRTKRIESEQKRIDGRKSSFAGQTMENRTPVGALQIFGRVLVRFDYHDANYLGLVWLAYRYLLLNYFWDTESGNLWWQRKALASKKVSLTKENWHVLEKRRLPDGS